MRTNLKVCRVDTVLGAKASACAGADFVGLHAIDPWDLSYAKIHNFKLISAYLARNAPQCKPVLVTRSRDPAFIADACHLTDVSIVQLHEHFETTEIIHELAREFRQRQLPPPLLIKTVVLKTPDDIEEVGKWSPVSYALLFDSTHVGGSGEKADWELIRRAVGIVGHGMTFVAGGLSKDNVHLALSKSGAGGADIQRNWKFRLVSARV